MPNEKYTVLVDGSSQFTSKRFHACLIISLEFFSTFPRGTRSLSYQLEEDFGVDVNAAYVAATWMDTSCLMFGSELSKNAAEAATIVLVDVSERTLATARGRELQQADVSCCSMTNEPRRQ